MGSVLAMHGIKEEIVNPKGVVFNGYVVFAEDMFEDIRVLCENC